MLCFTKITRIITAPKQPYGYRNPFHIYLPHRTEQVLAHVSKKVQYARKICLPLFSSSARSSAWNKKNHGDLNEEQRPKKKTEKARNTGKVSNLAPCGEIEDQKRLLLSWTVRWLGFFDETRRPNERKEERNSRLRILRFNLDRAAGLDTVLWRCKCIRPPR